MLARWRAAGLGARLASLYAALALLASLLFPWWRMENRAPQYGMRVLWVNVSPFGVQGDIKEIDGLGHYVGMRPMGSLARVERALAPFAMAAAVAAALALPALKERAANLSAAVVMLVPVGFVADLWAWQRYTVSHLDPRAALNLIADRVDAQLVGEYSVAQFHVLATFQTGFWFTLVAAAHVAAFLVLRGDGGHGATA